MTNHLFGKYVYVLFWGTYLHTFSLEGGKCEATEEQISVYCVKNMNSTAFPSSENSYAAGSSLNGENYHSASKWNVPLGTW